mgnify:FL=1
MSFQVFIGQFIKNRLRRRRGAIMVFFALLAPLLLGVIGFAIDSGYLYAQKGKVQDIADAVVLAASVHLKEDDKSRREDIIKESFRVYLKANGFKDTSSQAHYKKVLQANDMENFELSEEDEWKLIWCVEEDCKDKDGGVRNHLAICLVRREPTFFIKLILPEQKSVVMKAAAAAEWVEKSGDGARKSRVRLVR